MTMNEYFGDDIDEEPQPREELTEEEAEARAEEERRQHDQTMGHYYKGIWQGLVLGIFGNLLVSFFLGLFRELIPKEWWWCLNLVGLLTMTVITGVLVWKMFVTAETYLQNKSYIDQLKQDIKETVKSIIKFAIIIAMIFLVFYGLKLFNVLADTILSAYNITNEVGITERISIDFFGGILPTVIFFIFLFYLIYFRKFKIKSWLQDFIMVFILIIPCSSLIHFILNVPDSILNLNSLTVDYYLVGLIASLFAVFRTNGLITYVRKSIKNRKLNRLTVSLKNSINSLLLAFSYASLAVLALDLIGLFLVHSFSSDITIYIGALGIVDGIMLAPLTSLLLVLLFTLVLFLIKEILNLFSRKRIIR